MIRVTLLFGLLICFNTVFAQVQNNTKSPYFKLQYDSVDSGEADRIRIWLGEGRKELITFFDQDFKSEFEVFLFSNRDSLDKQWQKDWNMPGFKSQCWMVASGIAHRLDVLSPRVWSEQACEHDAGDSTATRKLIVHEMIHVFHGQYNPSPTFENIDNIDWFVEGIAVYASGQLNDDRYQDTRNFLLNEEGPALLSEVWKGQNRYGLAGSLVHYVDQHFGRAVLIDFLGLTTATQMLDYLDVTEDVLITRWKSRIRTSESIPVND